MQQGHLFWSFSLAPSLASARSRSEADAPHVPPQLKQFFSANAALLSSAQREAKQAVEYSTTNVAWMKKNYDTIVRWLKEQERR